MSRDSNQAGRRFQLAKTVVLICCITVITCALCTATVWAQVGGAVNGKENSRVSNDLLKLHNEYQIHIQTMAPSAFRPSDPVMRMLDGAVVVDAVAAGDAEMLRVSLEGLGLRNASVFGRMVSGLLPIESIPQLEDVADLNFIRPAYAETGIGLVTSQGDVALRAGMARTVHGVNGGGLTVGTLSDSYDCLGGAAADVASLDLPAGVVVLQELTGCANATDEGRGMMQIIRDLAPGAAQAFHSAFLGQADFATGIVELATVANCDIICDDVFYFSEPFFQDGIIAQAVDQVVGMNIPYFSLAGNHGRKSYEANFRTTGISPPGAIGPADAHDFDPGAGVDVYQQVTIPVGKRVTISFQWDQPFFSVSGGAGCGNDLDIFIYDNPPTAPLASSISANVGGDAVEVLTFTNTGPATTFNIVLTQYLPGGGPMAGRIKYIALVNGGLTNFVVNQFDTQSSTVYGHMNANLGTAVGAAFYANTPAFGTTPPVREAYSSAGNTRILFDTAGNPTFVTRQRPNYCAVDGVNNTFFGGSDPEPDGFPNFYGTSAAAPHAAAVAALLMDAVPGLTPAQVYSTLENTALNMGPPGFDTDTGWGLINANRAICLWDADPPDITCPADITIDCNDGNGGVAGDDPQILAFLGGASASDECGTPVITDDAPLSFPLGDTDVTFTATDDAGNTNTCMATVTVQDTTPPEITIRANRRVLWPPNHKMVYVQTFVDTWDECCDVDYRLISVTSNEPDNGKGDGNTTGDIQILGRNRFMLRAERMGGGDGRVYTIHYRAHDCADNRTNFAIRIRVPHDHSGFAFASSGFTSEGIGFDPALDRFALVIRSTEEEWATDENGNTTLVSVPFDALTVDVSQAYVGNAEGVVLPEEVREIDNNADGLMDLVLFYPASDINTLIYASTQKDEGEIDFDISPGPIGLHYTDMAEVDYLVPNIFGLGEPVPVVPPIDLGRRGAPEAPDIQDTKVTELMPSYPNPFNPSTTVPFNLSEPTDVTLRVYDARGALVRTLKNESLPAGVHRVVWDGRDMNGHQTATGVYFVRLLAGSYEMTQKIVLIK